MERLVFDSPGSACRKLAVELAGLIRRRAAEGRPAVIGFATGSSPLPLYRELVRLHREEGLSFAGVVGFNLDEYIGLPPGDPLSYRAFMCDHLFSLVDILPGNFHLPDAEEGGEAYERRIAEAGGIDFQILGIGRNGHIGFNEPGSAADTRTRRVELDARTRADAAQAFGGLDRVPRHAVTMGCETILKARKIALLAWGENKAEAVAAAIGGPVTEDLPASFLQRHPSVTFYLDRGAAGALLV
jgi:glucosamine-6-phosphate deaminase